MQTVKSISSANPVSPNPISPYDEGYHLLVDRTTGALIVRVTSMSGASISISAPDAEGDVATANPQVVAGLDVTDKVRALRTTADGRLLIDLDNATIVGGNILVQLDSASDSVEVLQASHDDLNANANIQVGNADVGAGNPVPVSIASLPLQSGAGNVSAGTQRVTIATDDANIAAMKAKLDSLYTELQAKADLTETQPTSDNGPGWTDVRANISSADLTSETDLTAAPTAGQKIVVTDIVVSADTQMRVDFIEETTGTVLFSVFLPADGTVPLTTRGRFKLDTADKKLRAQASAAGNIRIFCLYHSEA